MEFKGYKRYYKEKLLDAQTPVDHRGLCWCVDEKGKGNFYRDVDLTLEPKKWKHAKGYEEWENEGGQ